MIEFLPFTAASPLKLFSKEKRKKESKSQAQVKGCEVL